MRKGENPGSWIFTWHEYDLDLTNVFLSLQELMNEGARLKTGLDRDTYLDRIRSLTEHYCDTHGIDLAYHLQHGGLIIPSDDPIYELFLALAILTRDRNKLRPFLAHQQKNYSGQHSFADLMEFRVYELMDKYRPFDIPAEQQSILMKWVEEQHAKDRPRMIADKSQKKPGRKKEPLTAEQVFHSPSEQEQIMQLLRQKEVINADGTWVGFSSTPSEITVLIEVLIERGFVKRNPKTILGRFFCSLFSIRLSDRSLRNESQASRDHRKEYEKIIPMRRDVVSDESGASGNR